MKNAMKKLLSLMLVAVLLVSAVPFKASAESTDPIAVPFDVYVDGVYNRSGSYSAPCGLSRNMDQDFVNCEIMNGYALDRIVGSDGNTATGVPLTYNNLVTYNTAHPDAPYSITVYLNTIKSDDDDHDEDKNDDKNEDIKKPITVPVTIKIDGTTTSSSITADVGYNRNLDAALATTLVTFDTSKYTVKWIDLDNIDQTGKPLTYDNLESYNASGKTYSITLNIEKIKTEDTTPGTPSEPDIDDSVDIVVGNGDKRILVTLDWNVTGMKDNYVRVTDPATKMGTVKEAIQKSGLIPKRANYTFAGWYWDDDYDYPVKDNEYVTSGDVTNLRIYAKWTRDASANNVFLKIYLNGKTSSTAKIVDISSYGDADGTIDIYEAKRAAGSYYSSTGYDGLFTDTTWKGGAYNNSDQTDSVAVNANGDTFIYIMLWGAKATSTSSSSSSSSGTADSSNYKTGDTVYTVMTVMGLSVAALAAVCYVSKKRAF
ncbi:MAG: hypothetical protein ACI4PH_03115 [Faecousia sp.]